MAKDKGKKKKDKGKKKAQIEIDPELQGDDELDELEVLEPVEQKPRSAKGGKPAVDTEGKLSAKQAAKEIGTDARALRKFLRGQAGKIGQGNRWYFDPKDIPQLKLDFEAAKGKSKPARDDSGAPKPKAKSKAKAKTEVIPDSEIYGEELPEVDDLDDFDFSDLDDLDL